MERFRDRAGNRSEAKHMANTGSELGQDGLTRRVYSKRHSLILAFLLVALTEGASEFVPAYYLTINGLRQVPSWANYNWIIGASILDAISKLIFPMALFVIFYSLGDRFQLRDNVGSLSLTIAAAGWIGSSVGYVLGLLAFYPVTLSPLDYIQATVGVTVILVQAFTAFAAGFSAILLRQLRTRAVWIA